MLDIINEYGLSLINSTEKCKGVVTRIDPRNGNTSTLDLAICNEYMSQYILNMSIDEEGLFQPTKYTKKKITKTDHNSIIINIKAKKRKIVMKSFINTNNGEGRMLFKQEMMKMDLSKLFSKSYDINRDYDELMVKWEKSMVQSFKKISPRNAVKGLDRDIKDLMEKERWIKKNVLDNAERCIKLSVVRKKISDLLEKNLSHEMSEKVIKVSTSKNPQAEIFKIRRECKTNVRVDFPLKDGEGNVQVTKQGIDKVISVHFKKVVNQNPVPEGEVWKVYWEYIDKIYDVISNLEKTEDVSGPTVKEISELLTS